MFAEPKGKIIMIWNHQQEGLRRPGAGSFGLVREVREDFIEGAMGKEPSELGDGVAGAGWRGDDIGYREEAALMNLQATGENFGPFP